MEPLWSISIISHGHAATVAPQVSWLAQCDSLRGSELILTMNQTDEAAPETGSWPGPVRVIRNTVPNSFAANHNAAASVAQGRNLAFLDPDLQWSQDVFPLLAATLERDDVGLVAPAVVDETGALCDHARPAPTPWHIIRRYVLRHNDGLHLGGELQAVPWLAGLFLTCRREHWGRIGGFDESYRLYAEDVELSLRCWLKGLRVLRVPEMAACHPARRESRKNFRRMTWHLRGLLRLWCGVTWRNYSRRVRAGHLEPGL